MEAIKKWIKVNADMMRQDNDSVIGIFGKEGSSKSTLGLWLQDLHCDEFQLDKTVEDIGLNTNDFKKAIKRNRNIFYGCPGFDEAQDGLYSREAMKGHLNIILNKTYMTIRGKRLFTRIIMPSFFDLDTYFRSKRLRGAWYCYKRGHAVFYTGSQLARASFQSSFKGISPILRDTFPDYQGVLRKPYNLLKTEKMNAQIDKLDEVKDLMLGNTEFITECLKRNIPVPIICKYTLNEEGKPIHNSYVYRLRSKMMEA